jgi:DNA-3-methyladenine glycosylase
LQTIDFTFDPLAMARALIGARFTLDGVGGVIVETEAYDPTDPASHSFIGMTPRNAVMFGPPGCLYVYRSYGIHWCANIVCGGRGGAVLLRAIQPTDGLEIMRARRGVEGERLLCSGPGKLCQALAISIAHNGADLERPPFEIVPPKTPLEVIAGPRIGISKAVERPWRFGLKGSRFLSKPFPMKSTTTA